MSHIEHLFDSIRAAMTSTPIAVRVGTRGRAECEEARMTQYDDLVGVHQEPRGSACAGATGGDR